MASKTTKTASDLDLGTKLGNGWAYATDEDQHAAARELTRGCYQLDIADGDEAVSGSTLKGKAQSYAGRYKDSSASFLQRCVDAGIPVSVVRVERRHVVVFGAYDGPAPRV